MRVRDRGTRGLGWWTRAWLCATVAWAVVAVLAVLPLGAGTVAQAHADDGSVSVPGPPVWLPNAGPTDANGNIKGALGDPGTVTVSPARNLTNQMVHVSWTGFTPTTANGNQVLVPSPGDVHAVYQVRVYQCRGADPKPTDCYGSTVYGSDPALGFEQAAPPPGVNTPEFPSNMALAVTGSDGTGSADIEVWSGIQSQTLGCDADHACSIVVEPEWGGDSSGIGSLFYGDGSGAINCDDHEFDSADSASLATDSTINGQDAVTGNATGEACAWTHRAVVPLTFAQTAASCKNGATDFSTAGLPMAERALQQWRAGACLAANPQYVGYTSLGEPQTRQSFLRGSGADVALTALPDTSPHHGPTSTRRWPTRRSRWSSTSTTPRPAARSGRCGSTHGCSPRS